MREFWNQKFAGTAYKYGEQPNAFLFEQAGLIPPGSQVLVPGDGEGRNGVWLATQGHHVTSVDCSDVGRDGRQTFGFDREHATPAGGEIEVIGRHGLGHRGFR